MYLYSIHSFFIIPISFYNFVCISLCGNGERAKGNHSAWQPQSSFVRLGVLCIRFSKFSHLLNTLTYNLKNSTVVGGRSRFYLIDLASSDRSKVGTSLSISNMGNVLLSIFNGQKHIPHRYTENVIGHLISWNTYAVINASII